MQTPPLTGKKVLYAITDPAGIRLQLPPLFKRLWDLTFVLTERISTVTGGEVRDFPTLEDALAYASTFDVLILQAVGNFVVDYRFLRDIDTYLSCRPSVAIMVFPPQTSVDEANILSNCRMLVANMTALKDLGYCGSHPMPECEKTKSPSIGGDGVHSDLAPRELAYASTNSLVERIVAATKAESIGTDPHIVEFPQSILRSAMYIWPEVNSETLLVALTNSDPSLTEHPDQRRWIRMSEPRPVIWIYNSEPYRFAFPLGNRDVYFGPAAGFKYLDILAHNPFAEFVIYDVNPASLRWIEWLRQDWDGRDYLSYLGRQPGTLQRMFKSGSDSVVENQRRLLREFGGESRFRQLWQRFKVASVRFATCDLFNLTDVNALISPTRATMPFFYYSNVFSTNFTLSRSSREQAEESYRCFIDAVTTRFPKALLHGADVAGRWH